MGENCTLLRYPQTLGDNILNTKYVKLDLVRALHFLLV